MSGGRDPQVPCPEGAGVGSLYSEVQCIMGNGHMGPVDRQTRVKTLPSRNFAGGR